MTNVIYEVNLTIQKDTVPEFVKWLKDEHIKDVLAFKGFKSADMFQVESTKEGFGEYCCQYHVETREDLEDYLTNHAPRMRQHGLDKFGSKFSATRRILHFVDKF